MRRVMHFNPVILAASTLSFACGRTSTQQAGTTPDTRAAGIAGTRTASDSHDEAVHESLPKHRQGRAIVSMVWHDSPAERAPLRAGDVNTTFLLLSQRRNQVFVEMRREQVDE